MRSLIQIKREAHVYRHTGLQSGVPLASKPRDQIASKTRYKVILGAWEPIDQIVEDVVREVVWGEAWDISHDIRA